ADRRQRCRQPADRRDGGRADGTAGERAAGEPAPGRDGPAHPQPGAVATARAVPAAPPGRPEWRPVPARAVRGTQRLSRWQRGGRAQWGAWGQRYEWGRKGP